MLLQQNRHGYYGSTLGWTICSVIGIAVVCLAGQSVPAEGLGFIFTAYGQRIHLEEPSNTKLGLGLVLALRAFIGQIFFGAFVLWIGMHREIHYTTVIRPLDEELASLRYVDEALLIRADFQSIGYRIIGPPVICIVMTSLIYSGVLTTFPKAMSKDICLAAGIAIVSAAMLKDEWSK